MREILFRGKTKDSGEWICGEYITIYDDPKYIVVYNHRYYEIRYIEKYARFAPILPNTVFCVFAYDQGEVIGNVFDNPEFLKGDAEG